MHILLINPNSAADTTVMMTDIARSHLPPGFSIEGVTAEHGPPMILTPAALAAAEKRVVRMAFARRDAVQGIIVSAFGDPGLAILRQRLAIPATGLCEASMIEAAEGGRRFGIATVTPDLVASFAATANMLGLDRNYAGTRLTFGDPQELAKDHQRLTRALEIAIRECIELDGADSVIVGGGPLGQAAESLQGRFTIPVIAPIRSATRHLATRMATSDMPAA